MSNLVINKSKVSDTVRKFSEANNYDINNISNEFLIALDAKVKQMIKESVVRAKSNGRRTVMGKDV